MKDEKGRPFLETCLDAYGYVEDKLSDIRDKVEDAISDKVDDLRTKADEIVSKNVGDGKVDQTTIGMTTGAAKIGYGIVRGLGAVAGIFGHGIAGFLTRHHNPIAAREYVKHGFEDAEKYIGQGLEVFKEALEERRKK